MAHVYSKLRYILLTALVLSVMSGCEIITKSDDVTADAEIAEGGNLIITHTNGDILVTGTDDESVSVEAHRTVSAYQRDDALLDTLLESMVITVTENGGNVEIETDIPSSSEWEALSASVEFTITVPADAALDIESVNGDVRIKSMDGEIEVTLENGDVEITDISNSVDIETTNGDIDVRHPAWLAESEEIICESQNGDIEIGIPSNSAFSVKAETLLGSIDNGGFDFFVDNNIAFAMAEDDVNDGGASLDLSTGNGSIDFIRLGEAEELPEGPGALEGFWTGTGAVRALALQFITAPDNEVSLWQWDDEAADWYESLTGSFEDAALKRAGELLVSISQVYNSETGLMEDCLDGCSDALSWEVEDGLLEITESENGWFTPGVYAFEE